MDLLLLLCLIDTGSSLDCHQCNSYEHAHCADPFYHADDVTKEPKTKEYLLPCPDDGKDYFCRKIYQNVRGDERVIRTSRLSDTLEQADQWPPGHVTVQVVPRPPNAANKQSPRTRKTVGNINKSTKVHTKCGNTKL